MAQFTDLFIKILIFTSGLTIIFGQSSSPSIPDEIPDSYIDGRDGYPGGRVILSPKALDSIYDDAIDQISENIKSIKLPDVPLPIGQGVLSIRGAKIINATMPSYDRQLEPPNLISSRLYGGSIRSEGEWQYRPMNAGVNSGSIRNGKFSTVVSNAELTTVTKLSRSGDGKPLIEVTSCDANLSQFQVIIEGHGAKPTIINECDNFFCKGIKSFFNKAVCDAGKKYVADFINKKLSTFPARFNLGSSSGAYWVDYRLLPKDKPTMVTEKFIHGDIEGEVFSRGNSAAKFNPAVLSITDFEKDYTFALADFAFNSLLLQAHQSQHPFTSSDIFDGDSSLWQSLSPNCSSELINVRGQPTPTSPKPASNRRSTWTTTARPTTTNKSNRVNVNFGGNVGISRTKCLGEVFDNSTDGQFRFGNIVYKSSEPIQIFVNGESEASFISNKKAILEVYGADNYAENPKSSKLIYRAQVKKLAGHFSPKINGANITGSVQIHELELVQQPITSTNRGYVRNLSDQSLEKLTELAKPVLSATISKFLTRFAQFPVPLVEGYECASPELRWSSRTIQINCVVKPKSSSRLINY